MRGKSFINELTPGSFRLESLVSTFKRRTSSCPMWIRSLEGSCPRRANERVDREPIRMSGRVRRAQCTHSDLAEEVSATFTHLLKNEMFPSPSSRTGSPARPAASPTPKNKRKGLTFVNSHAPNLPTPHTVSSAGTTPLHHHPPPAIAGDRDGGRELSPASTLPPLPMHAPSTPTSGHGRAPGAGPSSTHHRAHQSQVSLTSASRSGTSPPGGRKSAFSPPPSMGPPSPSTPTKKRLLSFQSPSQARMASLAGSLDDMGHEKYRLSPVGKSSQDVLLSPRKGIRQIARTPFKVLDAPELTVGSSGGQEGSALTHRTISISTSFLGRRPTCLVSV